MARSLLYYGYKASLGFAAILTEVENSQDPTLLIETWKSAANTAKPEVRDSGISERPQEARPSAIADSRQYLLQRTSVEWVDEAKDDLKKFTSNERELISSKLERYVETGEGEVKPIRALKFKCS